MEEIVEMGLNFSINQGKKIEQYNKCYLIIIIKNTIYI